MSNIGMTPSHPGPFIRRQILEPLDLSITKAAKLLGVRRATLSNLVNNKTSLSPEMAYRLEKAFDIKMDFLLRMQVFYDTARIRKKNNITEKLLKDDEEFKKIYSEHRELDEVVKNLEEKGSLTMDDLVEIKRLKKIKLYLKDRMEAKTREMK